MDSDCLFFNRKTVVVGAGYIAVELAGMMQILGSDVSLLIRYDKVISECRFVYLICARFSQMSGISLWCLVFPQLVTSPRLFIGIVR